ncbi:hypothetical protein [Actinokineospora diospyrosa]|uniref:Uncharacterized protein n=1 Tax=Actinokineospora diospyrosa TaxID=103728 RepID=A0ABT1I6C1_9PSEU|nr:hypothetical protein [Actinokineospora diospyrosa]MCP2268172.1 hypothetical protein [Actinokineospora diospyrosa]
MSLLKSAARALTPTAQVEREQRREDSQCEAQPGGRQCRRKKHRRAGGSCGRPACAAWVLQRDGD